MSGQIPEPHDPPGPGDGTPRNAPAGSVPIYPAGRTLSAVTAAEQSRPLPIAYGTVKLPLLLAEKFLVVPPDLPVWAAATFNVGNLVLNVGNAYECVTAGTSVSGPTGTASDIIDGGTAHWSYRSQVAGDPPQWLASTQTVVGYIVQNFGNVYEALSAFGTTAASGGPSGTGGLISDGTVVWRWLQQLPFPMFRQRFLGALCEGEVTSGVSLWWDRVTQPAVNSGAYFVGGLELKKGPDAGGQSLLGIFDSSGYQHTAMIQPAPFVAGLPTRTKSELPNFAVELQAVMFGSAFPDVNPGDIINDLLTHARRGCVWPGSRVDTSITGTAAGGYRVYCDAAGFRFSMVLGEQRTAMDWIDDILLLTNSEAVWSGGKLKVVPLGDQNIASPVYGATGYVSANAVQYALGPNDFQRASWTRRKDPDCFNTWPIEYTDRAAGYATLAIERPDANDVEKRGGKVVARTSSLPVIFPDGTQPIMLSGILNQRSLYNRNTYRIEGVPWRYVLTEPTDVFSLTDPVTGLSLVPMRIIEWEEGADGETIDLTCEDYGTAVQAAARFTPQAGDGYKATEPGTLASIPSQVDGKKIGVAPGVVSKTQLSDGQGNTLNLWPNPTSEIDPPSGPPVLDNNTNPEFDFRFNAGVGSAFAGAWVRRLSKTGAVGDTRLERLVPAHAGEFYSFQAQLKIASGTGSCNLNLDYLDKDKAVITGGIGTGVTGAAWTLQTLNAPVAPAGTAYAKFWMAVTTPSGTTEAWFDQLVARRRLLSGDLGDQAVGTSNLVDANVTRAKLAAVGQQKSSGCGAFTTTSATYVDLTNNTVTMTTTGRPVQLVVQPGGGVASWNINSSTQDATFAILRDGSVIAEWQHDTNNARPWGIPNLDFLDDGATAAAHTWKVQVKVTGGVTLTINNWALVAYEL